MSFEFVEEAELVKRENTVTLTLKKLNRAKELGKRLKVKARVRE